ncbi:MAG: hypothetical protein SGPRY_010228, partial [Prymnesium sp.]
MRALLNCKCLDAAKVARMRRMLRKPFALQGQRTLSKVLPQNTPNGREVSSSHSTTESSKGREPHKRSPKLSTDDNVTSQGLLDWKHSRIAHSFDGVNDTNRLTPCIVTARSASESRATEPRELSRAETHAPPMLAALASPVTRGGREGYMRRTAQIACGYWYIINVPATLAFRRPLAFDAVVAIGYLFDLALMASRMGDIVERTKRVASLRLQIRACVFVKDIGADEGRRSCNSRSSLRT